MICITTVVVFVASEDGMELNDYMLGLSVFGVFLGMLQSRWIGWWGSAIFCTAMLCAQINAVALNGWSAVFQHLTHCTLAVLTFLKIVYLLVQVPIVFFGSQFAVQSMDYAAGCVSTLGCSLSLALWLAAASLLACSNGQVSYEFVQSGKGASFATSFILEHCMPFLGWLPTIAIRAEPHAAIGAATRAALWLSTVPVVTLLYFVTMLLIDSEVPSTSAMEPGTTLAVGAAGMVAWAACAFA